MSSLSMMTKLIFLVLALLASLVIAQQIGTYQQEVHPSLPTQICNEGGCETVQTSITLDSNWRWIHQVNAYTNCYTGDQWDTSICSSPQACAQNCALEGVDYESTYGISTQGNALNLGFVTQTSNGPNVGSRVYLMADQTNYQIFKLKNQEFTFDVQVSNLVCGLNGALYFVEMAADGGTSQYPTNVAGAQYGVGYCDAQCPQDVKFINGEGNTLDWTPSNGDPNSGTGEWGSCCVEMDIWEANSQASAYTPHACNPDVQGQTRCNGTACGQGNDRYDGICDKDGCDFNSYRMGNESFFGPRLTVDTTQLFTVVTQFITSDGTSNGNLTAVKRLYVQNGKTIENSYTNFPGLPLYNDITDEFCVDQKAYFDNPDTFESMGGLSTVGAALERGMVLVMSIWDDYTANMLWLDSAYPANGDPSTPGILRGPCANTSGVPNELESQDPNASVQFSNIRWGDIGTTFSTTD